ncbi:hypothetical protein ISCGN_009577 [Ixodes scapularis]
MVSTFTVVVLGVFIAVLPFQSTQTTAKIMKCITSVIKGLLLISAILALTSSLQDASAYVIDRECYVVLYENVTTCFYGCGTLSRQGPRQIIEVEEVGLKDGTPCMYENVTTCFYGCGTLSRQGPRQIIEVEEVGLKDGTPCMISPEMNGTCKNFICEENAA